MSSILSFGHRLEDRASAKGYHLYQAGVAALAIASGCDLWTFEDLDWLIFFPESVSFEFLLSYIHKYAQQSCSLLSTAHVLKLSILLTSMAFYSFADFQGKYQWS